MQEDPVVRRGRKPSSDFHHPLGALVRDRRLAKNWSIAELAAEVGIRATSISLISEIERGLRPPSLEVAEKLARVLDIPAADLVDWAHTRRSPRSVERVSADLSRYKKELPQLEESMRTSQSLWDERRTGATHPLLERAPGPLDYVATMQQESGDDVPVFGPGTDPDGRAARAVAWIARRHLPASLAEALVRPVAFVVSDEDFDRLRRPAYGTRRPRYAVVTRPSIHTIDPREPYAVRRRGQVKLAYLAWDGRELLILPPPGKGRFSRGSARPRTPAGRAGSGDARVGVRCSFPVSRTTGLPTG
jgi:transcriptional regulator with XRE-family HTH domain